MKRHRGKDGKKTESHHAFLFSRPLIAERWRPTSRMSVKGKATIGHDSFLPLGVYSIQLSEAVNAYCLPYAQRLWPARGVLEESRQPGIRPLDPFVEIAGTYSLFIAPYQQMGRGNHRTREPYTDLERTPTFQR